MLELQTLVIYSLVIALPAAFLISSLYLRPARSSPPPAPQPVTERPLKSIMQAPRDDLAPPKDDPFTTEELKKFDGSDSQLPVYVAIKGTIFDVSHKREIYGHGGSYAVFAGKDGSKGLGKSSLKPEDAVADYSELDEKEMAVLEQWHAFFSKRYNIVGKVVDAPSPNL